MNETGNPLKRLVHLSIKDFPEWLLGEEVIDVETANIELAADPDPIRADQLYRVTLVGGQQILFHMEFQGESSHKPMRLRMLDYITRIAYVERGVRIHSVVFYIGEGVGARDTGHHQVDGIGDRTTLSWHYDVVHLWKLSGEKLLALERPGLLPLIGQTKIENPEEVVPKVVSRIKDVEDTETQHRLFTELIALVTDEEVLNMVEMLIERDELVLDTPFLRRIRRQAEEQRQKGLEEGLEEGIEKGQKIGLEEGLETGHIQTRQQDILDLVVWRYELTAVAYRQIEKQLLTFKTREELARIFEAAARSEHFSDFQAVVEACMNEDAVKLKSQS